ncbi:MAG: SDR family oxidoreductase [candidate division Zixibacteria bacterium]|nr:SDR family oxidoreductase [candidate division Zixibacteria bacterium]
MAYAASKGGVIAATRFLAVYWARYNINVNCISPVGSRFCSIISTRARSCTPVFFNSPFILIIS